MKTILLLIFLFEIIFNCLAVDTKTFDHQDSLNFVSESIHSDADLYSRNWCEKNCKECYCVTDDYWNQYCYKCKQHCNEYKFKCNDDDDQWYPDYPDYPNDDDHWYDDDDDHYEDKFESVLEFLKQEDRLVENEHHLIQKEEKAVEKDISDLESYHYDDPNNDDWYDDDDDYSYDDDDDHGINIHVNIGDFNLNQNANSQHSSGAAISAAIPSLGATILNYQECTLECAVTTNFLYNCLDLCNGNENCSSHTDSSPKCANCVSKCITEEPTFTPCIDTCLKSL